MIALGVSVALNLFFIGFETARAINKTCPQNPPERAFVAHGKKGFHKRKGHFFYLTKKDREKMRKHMHQMKDVHEKMVEIIASENFDENVLKKAWNRSAKIRASFDEEMRDALIEKIKGKNLEERRAFAEKFKKMFPSHFDKKMKCQSCHKKKHCHKLDKKDRKDGKSVKERKTKKKDKK